MKPIVRQLKEGDWDIVKDDLQDLQDGGGTGDAQLDTVAAWIKTYVENYITENFS